MSKIYDHNVYVATTGVQPQMLVMVMNKKKQRGYGYYLSTSSLGRLVKNRPESP